MKKTVALLTVALLTAAGVARADGLDPIEIRQTGLDLLNGDFAGIKVALAAKGDLKTLEFPAQAIQRFAALMPSLFPKGSETGHNTKALPEVWSDQAGFQKAAANLGDAAGKLVVAVKVNDADAAAAAFKGVGEACGACHRTYRAK
ncbi:MAG: cytochrome c [Acetobacteraceae bacterium]|nr:cytochrome c [Acetobacteraceae bacterium]